MLSRGINSQNKLLNFKIHVIVLLDILCAVIILCAMKKSLQMRQFIGPRWFCLVLSFYLFVHTM